MILNMILKRFQWGPENLAAFFLTSVEEVKIYLSGEKPVPNDCWAKINTICSQFEKIADDYEEKLVLIERLSCFQDDFGWSNGTLSKILGISAETLKKWYDTDRLPGNQNIANVLSLLINVEQHGIRSITFAPTMAEFAKYRAGTGIPRRIIGEIFSVTGNTIANWEQFKVYPPEGKLDGIVSVTKSLKRLYNDLQRLEKANSKEKSTPVEAEAVVPEAVNSDVVDTMVEEDTPSPIAGSGDSFTGRSTVILRRRVRSPLDELTGEMVEDETKLEVWSAKGLLTQRREREASNE